MKGKTGKRDNLPQLAFSRWGRRGERFEFSYCTVIFGRGVQRPLFGSDSAAEGAREYRLDKVGGLAGRRALTAVGSARLSVGPGLQQDGGVDEGKERPGDGLEGSRDDERFGVGRHALRGR